jgi:heme-degrading monooxygenase HmoA
MYACVWEYRVQPAQERGFAMAYGHHGPWVALFQQSRGYVETRLYRNRDEPGRYLTVDTWESSETYEAFRRDFAAEYARLDAACEGLSLEEALIGHFDVEPG